MGAGSAKLLNNFVVGSEEKEDKLVKGKVERILTSGSLPKKPRLIWEHQDLNKNDNSQTMRSLLEGAAFIHGGRVANQNTMVAIQPKDPDSVVFATAYIMALSGLSPKSSTIAIERSLKDSGLKFTGQYDGALQLLRNSYNPKALREAVLEKCGPYPEHQLIEDVCRIYELAGILKPTDEQIRLEAPVDETRRLSLFGRQLLEGNRKMSKDSTTADPSASIQELNEKMKTEKDKISESLKHLAAENATKSIPDELISSLTQVNDEIPADLPKVLNKIKKRGELIGTISQYMKPTVNFDDWTLTDVGHDHDASIGHTLDSHSTGPSAPAVPHKPAEPQEPDTESKQPTDKKLTKGQSILDNFSEKMSHDIWFDNDTLTDSGALKPAFDAESSKHEDHKLPSQQPDSSVIEHDHAKSETKRLKITIIRAYSRDLIDSTDLVEQYLNSTTEEERRRNRKPVTIIRAMSKDVTVIED